MKRVLFLDFDGVLVNKRSLTERRPRLQRADPDCVAALNHITNTTGAVIVVSSSWRLDFDLDELTELFTAWGVTGRLDGTTPILGRGTVRGDEIANWLAARQVSPADIVILDDEADLSWLSTRLIRTESDAGLTKTDAERAIEMLTE